jgi:phosphatidylglycerophosphate synthase
VTSFAETLHTLRTAQKSSRGAPAYSRYINRPFGRVLAAAAHTLRLAPNTVTLLSGATTLSGIALIALAPPSLVTSIVVTALLVLGYALDSADGQVARLRGQSSYDGEWLDHIIDAVKMATIHTAVLIAWVRWFDLDTAWLFVPIVFQVTASVFFFAVVLADLLRRVDRATRSSGPPPPDTAQPGTSALYSLAVIPADYGLLCVIFLLLWLPPVFVTVYTALAVLNLLILAASLFRWFRGMKRLG